MAYRSVARDSTLSPISPSISRLESLLQELFAGDDSAAVDLQHIEGHIERLQEVRLILIDSSHRAGRVKDDFRRFQGFEACLKLTESFPAFLQSLTQPDAPSLRAVFEALRSVLAVLSEALLEHVGNRDYFAHRQDRSGWATLQEALSRTYSVSFDNSLLSSGIRSRVFSLLFAFALREEDSSSVFKHWRSDAVFSIINGLDEDLGANVLESDKVEDLEQRISELASSSGTLVICEAVGVIVDLWRQLSAASIGDAHTEWPAISNAVLLAICGICNHSEYNAVSVHDADILGTFLHGWEHNERLCATEAFCLDRLCSTLLKCGVTSRSDAQDLFQMAERSSRAKELLLTTLRESKQPPHFLFDLSLYGFASIEFASMTRDFPPREPSAGYTFAAWINIANFDSSCHTTLCGAFDESQTCFLLLYIEKDSRQLVLQTSVTSSRPSVRFRSLTFKPRRWYHVALVHQRSKAENTSRASLFINGEFCEHLKCHFPQQPPLGASKSTQPSLQPPRSNQQSARVQAFFGTPRDLSPRPGSSMLQSRWSMACAQLIGDALSDELVFVIKNLGPGYQGNFRDSLGSFQTYHASALVNIRNEKLNPTQEDRSLIARAIKGFAAHLIPEKALILSISAQRVIKSEAAHAPAKHGLGHMLPRAIENIQKRIRSTGVGQVVVNQAIPSITDALLTTSGLAVMTGGMNSCRPGRLDDWSWSLSGCVALALQSVISAANGGDITQGLDIAFELVKNSWRNSEAFERENGFALIAWLIRSHLQSNTPIILSRPEQTGPRSPSPSFSAESIHLRLLDMILEFVGYDKNDVSNSIIINPLAYRCLLLDTDIWRTSDVPTQQLFYRQFVSFASASKNSEFNLKRYVRMRTAKKLLDSLKGAAVQEQALDCLLDALKVLFVQTPSSDLYRSVALYITYATSSASLSWSSKQRSQSADALRKRSSVMSLRAPRLQETTVEAARMSKIVSQEDLGAKVLQVFADMLLNGDSTAQLRRFAKTVTNKWLLFLLMTRREDIVVPSLCIIAKLLMTQPTSYLAKFEQSSKGFAVLKKALKQWCGSYKVWKACFALLVGIDVGLLELDKQLNAEAVWSILAKRGRVTVAFPAILPVMLSMLEYKFLQLGSSQPGSEPARFASQPMDPVAPREVQDDLLLQVTQLLVLCDKKIPNFRDAEISSHFVRDCMRSLSATLTPPDEDELLSDLNHSPDFLMLDQARNRHEALDPIFSHLEQHGEQEGEHKPPNPREYARRRLSSFVLVRLDGTETTEPDTALVRGRASSRASLQIIDQTGTALLEVGAPSKIVDILISMFADQILFQKDFTGLGLFMKASASPPKRRALLNSYLMARTSSSIEEAFKERPDVFRDAKAIMNLARFTTQTYEALVEGWFIDGSVPLITFCSRVLQHLEHGQLKDVKTVLLCAPAIREIRLVLRKTSILQLYFSTVRNTKPDTLNELDSIGGWQSGLVPPSEADDTHCGALACCLLTLLMTSTGKTFGAALKILRSIASDDPERLIPFAGNSQSDFSQLRYEFFSVLVDNSTELPTWIEAHKAPLASLIEATCHVILEPFIDQEIKRGDATAATRASRRKERLEQWHLDDVALTHTWTEFSMAARHWTENIYTSESRRLSRMRQDQQENSDYLQNRADHVVANLARLGLDNENKLSHELTLDNIEGRDRMRLRLAPVSGHIDHTGYEPKRAKALRRSTAQKTANQLGLDTSKPSPRVTQSPSPVRDGIRTLRSSQSQHFSGHANMQGDDFEVIASPTVDDEDEDKNRKVLRSLERGEQVKNVYNVSKIVGLEAYESLLIIGSHSLYIIGGLFQRSDGEVVSVRHAPAEERDKYTQIITGREIDTTSQHDAQIDARSHWLWSDILSISKRQFLTRPVALEFFFSDGRSFLMTALDSRQRNALHGEVITHISETRSKTQIDPSDAEWRMDLLKDREETTSRFSQVLAPMLSNPVSRRWLKGELSNFHYLMYVNTMAGRTFNDLTQYPVFPWVIADYTSEELDLSSPYTYRDLSKPMGCQKYERGEAFKERYASFAEMDDQTPAFHYGTHYSTAMIVTSFLIRLQPFVHSHVLLQGGNFDFADRLFYSIEKAWSSASSDTLSDVRELIPEFFYLPDFLTNVNGYDFGTREGSGEAVNDVQLPAWAKGDPNIFIAKNREALESPYVTQNLHHWIDLIFGFKQRGEAAIEAVNVFHYLSYPGAKDLDQIQDQHERKATIGIIHNFGQTPRQVFSRPHDRREAIGVKGSRVRKSIQSMAMSTTPVLERGQMVVDLRYARKLYAATPRSILVPPTYNIIMDWGFTDHSIRFTSLDSSKVLGTFEQLHQLPLSAAHFSDRKTLITASDDNTMSVWTIRNVNDRIELHVRGSLFDHRAPVTILASSKAFGTLLSASTDGVVHLWDLNTLELIRSFKCPHIVESADISETSGHVLLCCDDKIFLYTLNGQLLIEQRVCQEGDGLTSCAFRGHANDSWSGSEIMFTGHKQGFVNVWELATLGSGAWVLARINQLRNDRRFAANPTQRPPWITCILPLDGKVFVGDRDGCAYEWNATK